MAAYLCPSCPSCGAPPLMGVVLGGGTQAFCSGGDDCPVFAWNPSRSAEENLAEAVPLIVTEIETPEGKP